MTKINKMDNWRLSKIEEELKKLSLDSVPAETARLGPKSLADSNSKPHDKPEEDICSKIIIRPAYRKTSRTKDVHKAAVRRFNEKYDSPHSVAKSDPDAEKTKNETSTATTTATTTTRSPKPEEFQSSPTFLPPNWNRSPENSSHTGTNPPKLSNGAIRQEIQNCGIEELTPYGEKTTVPVDEQQQQHFVFRTLTIPAIPRESESDQRIRDNDGLYSRIGPPTAAKTFYSSFRGHNSPVAKENVNSSRLEFSNKICAMPPETTETVKSRPSYDHPTVDPVAPHSRSPTIALQDDRPWTRRDQFPVDTFPEPPPKFIHQEIKRAESPVRERDVQRENSQTHSDHSPSGLSETKVFPKRDDHLVVNASCFSGDQGDSYTENPVSGRAAEQRRCEYISTETQEIRNLANSYNTCYPRYGTLKATRRHRNSPTSADPTCELLPPSSGPGLSDEDRNQVEMFYRSHESRVFAARCEANLYLGSARRHSSVHASRTAAVRALTESSSSSSPENWLLLKRGVPVLVLDTGESRRQRRLHVILAERGSGFVLWRDTVDHLTGYSISPDVGFHTMHLSKDHTKLAGLYFSDPIHAGDFFDYLNNLTSDPDDPLLSLSSSSGTRKGKKDRKSSTKRKREEKKKKRKPTRREDISTPCCFVHVTKLDHCDVSSTLDGDMTPLE